jgi:hydroxypyruvate reductase
MRDQAMAIFQAGLRAVDPEEAIFRHVRVEDDILRVGNGRLNLQDYDRITVVGAGKAVAPMAKGLEEVLGDRIARGVIVVKEGHGLPLHRIRVCEGGHPVPDEQGVDGTAEILSLVAEAGERDLVICAISGGGSSLLIAPVEGVSLEDKQQATKLLLGCGATIHEMNTVRKHLSQVKGGWLAHKAAPATVVSLILSDVVGDNLNVIASGPTVPDSSTFRDAEQVLSGYGIWEQLAPSVRNHISAGMRGESQETPDSGDGCFARTFKVMVGTNLQALKAAKKEAERQGYRTMILSSKVEGEAREVAKAYAAIGKEIVSSGHPIQPPACILSGGETTVTLKGDGRGGRNQEFALAAALALAGEENIVVLSGGTDGTDGPTNAAGAMVDGTTVARARDKGLDSRDHLRRNDAYPFFQALQDLVITGPTRTNVMDMYMLLVAGERL